MKFFYLLLALLPAALAVPALQDTSCTCPPPTCAQPAEDPAGCECRNQATLDCFDRTQAAGISCPAPVLPACSKSDLDVLLPRLLPPLPLPRPRKEKPPPAVKPNPGFKCPCQRNLCIQSFPESCECANRQARDCYDNCGGLEPVYENGCGFGDETLATQKQVKEERKRRRAEEMNA